MSDLASIRARAHHAFDPLVPPYDGRVKPLARDVLVLCDIAEAAEAVYAATDLDIAEAMDGLGAALSRLWSPEGDASA